MSEKSEVAVLNSHDQGVNRTTSPLPQRLALGRNRWSILARDPELIKATIEQEARDFIGRGGKITKKGLIEGGRGDLVTAVRTYYPGQFRILKYTLGVKNSKQKGYWTAETVKNEAAEFLVQEGSLTQKSIAQKRADLGGAISTKYPGRLSALKRDMGLTLSQKVKWWNTERILTEAQKIYAEHGKLTQQLLINLGRQDLLGALSNHYPGKLTQLQVDVCGSPSRMPKNFLTPEQIEQEARVYFQETGKFGSRVLEKDGKNGLLYRVKHLYPGGILALRKKLGKETVTKEPGYWTVDVIKKEALSFINQHNDFTIPLLKSHGMGGLARACRKYYPGGLMQLRIDLGLNSRSKPTSYWQTEERMKELENQALGFYQQHGDISQQLLKRHDKKDLIYLFYKCYPGGINAIKEKLGIGIQTNNSEVRDISSDDADEALGRLIK